MRNNSTKKQKKPQIKLNQSHNGALDVLALERLALANVVDPDRESIYRKICRWFSKEYHTPLPQVEWDLEPGYVLQHYFEYHLGRLYESKDESTANFSEWEQELHRVLQGGKADEEAQKRISEDDEWAAKLKAEIEAEEKKHKEKNKLEEDNNPNLEEEIIASRSGETEPPNFPEG